MRGKRRSMAKYGQVDIEYIERFPRVPSPFGVRDWQKTALAHNQIVFDTEASGEYLPLIKVSQIKEPTTGGYTGEIFAIPSYVGREVGRYGEALTCLGAVLGGALAGVDKRNDRRRDWVRMSEAYFSVVNGHGLVLNDVDMDDGIDSFWYGIFPSCLFYHIGALYPDESSFADKMRAVADSWRRVLPRLYGNWEHTGYDFPTMTSADSGRWVEPDAAVGIAYLQYVAYLRWGDTGYLDAAQKCMEEMSEYPSNPYYEILGSYGPYLAARMNAEVGTNYPIDRFLSYVFHFSSGARPGWGIIGERWGDYDAYGLSGSTTDTAGYAFSMNTYVTAGVVAPMVRYAPQYARAIGRWLLHVAANSSLYFPDFLPADMQSEYSWYEKTGIDCISYEGVRNRGNTTPFATGDATHYFNPYGSWGSGFMAALFHRTNVAEILQIDVLKTDFEHKPAYPTYLYYNPLTTPRYVEIDVGKDPVDVYDAVTKEFLASKVFGTYRFELPADQAALLVLAPTGGRVTWDGSKMLVDDIVVDYNAKADISRDGGKVAMPMTHLAHGRPAAVSSAVGSEHGGEAAVDSDWRTEWKAAAGMAQWITIDLEAVYDIRNIKLRWGKDFARAYRIQVSSDGEIWEEAYEADNGDGGLDDIVLPAPLRGRFVRVYCTDAGEADVYSLIELEVYGNAVNLRKG